jgi:hypothetical protein
VPSVSTDLTPDEQYTAITDPGFPTALRVKAAAVEAALVGCGAHVDGVAFLVNDVPVTITFGTGGDVQFAVGATSEGKPWYEWTAPGSWLVP